MRRTLALIGALVPLAAGAETIAPQVILYVPGKPMVFGIKADPRAPLDRHLFCIGIENFHCWSYTQKCDVDAMTCVHDVAVKLKLGPREGCFNVFAVATDPPFFRISSDNRICFTVTQTLVPR